MCAGGAIFSAPLHSALLWGRESPLQQQTLLWTLGIPALGHWSANRSSRCCHLVAALRHSVPAAGILFELGCVRLLCGLAHILLEFCCSHVDFFFYSLCPLFICRCGHLLHLLRLQRLCSGLWCICCRFFCRVRVLMTGQLPAC